MEKKRFGAFLKHFSLAQNTFKSYHKRPKSRFNLQGTVPTYIFVCNLLILYRLCLFFEVSEYLDRSSSKWSWIGFRVSWRMFLSKLAWNCIIPIWNLYCHCQVLTANFTVLIITLYGSPWIMRFLGLEKIRVI